MTRLTRDWRLWAALTSTVVSALLTWWVVTTVQTQRDAIHTAKAATANAHDIAARANARISRLLAEIGTLQADSRANGTRIGQLTTEVTALQQQVRALGGQPVVVTGPGASRQPTQQPTSHPTGHPTSRPTPKPHPHPTPTPTCLLPPLVCPPGA